MLCVFCNDGVRVLVGSECVRLVLLWVGRCGVYCVIMMLRVLIGDECVGWW